ncbi:metallopeptidase TldD-related protein [Streptomyces sp. NPDC005423]|uniref:TldD/PmbA family protein n=1 Tax=Streptomyces sp. NPDC005423 TaxID=3155343 RepID=UPI0033B18514
MSSGDDYLKRLMECAESRDAVAEAGLVLTRSSELVAVNGRLDRSGGARVATVAVWTWRDGHEGYLVCTPDVPPQDAVDQALGLGERLAARAPLPAAAPTAGPPVSAPGLDPTPAEALEEPLRALSVEPGRRSGLRTELRLQTQHREVLMRHSRGFAGSYRDSTATVQSRVEAQGSGVGFGADERFGRSARRLLDGPAAESLREAEEEARAHSGAGALDGAPADVVLHGRVAAALLGLLAPTLMLDTVRQQRSRWGDRIGELVGVRGLSVVEDVTLDDAPVWAPFDDEGTPTRTVRLIADGVLREFLADRRTAVEAGATSTGSGLRGPRGEMPSVRAGCLLLSGGDGVPVQGDRQGDAGALWVTQAQGMHMANEVTGDFSFGASGLLVAANGRARPVRGFTVAGNVHRMMGRIEAAGRTPRYSRGWAGFVAAPDLRVTGLSLGT